jgi:mono/diheme cytochrome c family protein
MEGQMKHGWILYLPLIIPAAIVPVIAQSQAHQPETKTSAATPTAKPTADGDGELIFKQNCARCHDAPQGFSSRISGTIVRHMRVRASLSASDERQILKFLNP